MKQASVLFATALAQSVFPVPRRSIQQHSLWWLDTEIDEPLRMKKRCFHHLPQFLYLFLAASHVRVGHIWFLLHLHHRHRGVDLGREWDVDLVFIPVHTDSHSFFDICGCDTVRQIHHKLCKLLHVDDVFWIVCISINNLCAASNL